MEREPDEILEIDDPCKTTGKSTVKIFYTEHPDDPISYRFDVNPGEYILKGGRDHMPKFLDIIRGTTNFEKVDLSAPPETSLPTDPVLHPSHYASADIECIDAIRASMTPEEFAGYCKGNVMKYIWRYKHKNGLEDLEKASVYLTWLTNTLEGEKLKK